jgi:hypothetical protein
MYMIANGLPTGYGAGLEGLATAPEACAPEPAGPPEPAGCRTAAALDH